jgi:hypothetical protein
MGPSASVGFDSEHCFGRAVPGAAWSGTASKVKKEEVAMKTKDIERIVHRDPFKPFQFVLNNGEIVTVHEPRKASVSGDQVALVGISRFGKHSPRSERFRIIRIDNIAAADHVPDAKESRSDQ